MELLTQLHFLRPWWFLLLLPMLFLFWKFWQKKEGGSPWEAVCDRTLLPYILQKRHVLQTRLMLFFLALAWLLASIALAGPTWSRLPEQVYHSSQAEVIVLDMSPSMRNTDLSPNRFTRAKYKLLDLLKESSEGTMGLIVFSGEAYTVAPITRDTQTLINLASTLDLSLMPVVGENLAAALKLAGNLLEQAQANPASITVLLGGAPNAAAIATAKALAQKNIVINVLDISGSSTIKSNPLVKSEQGQYVHFTQGDQDIKTLRTDFFSSTLVDKKSTEDEVTQWKDQGRWFVLILLLFILLAFRRGGWDA